MQSKIFIKNKKLIAPWAVFIFIFLSFPVYLKAQEPDIKEEKFQNKIAVQVLFDGQPFVPRVPPQFSCLDVGQDKWINCDIFPNPDGPGYLMTRPVPGLYHLHIEIDENKNNPARYPGDYDVFHEFSVPPDSPVLLNVDVSKLIHLNAPWDNNQPLDGMLTNPASKKNFFTTPLISVPPKTKVTFSWDSVVPGAEYDYVVLLTRDSPYQRVGDIVRGKTNSTVVTLNLPATPPGHYLEFSVAAHHNGRLVGDFFTHDAGAQGWTCRFVIKNGSIPWLGFVLVYLIIFVLLWSVSRLPKVCLEKIVLSAPEIFLLIALANAILLVVQQNSREQNFLSAWQEAVPKPAWWDSVSPSALKIDSLGDLMSVWQSETSHQDGGKLFFKLAYQSILNHPEDRELVFMAIHLMFYVSDNESAFPLIKFGVENFFDHNQRTDNCAHCKIGDTTGEMVRDLAQLYVSRGDPDAAIEIIERLLTRDKDISDYNWALTFEVLSRAHWAKDQKEKAMEDIQEGLRRFPSGWQADQLRKTLENYQR